MGQCTASVALAMASLILLDCDSGANEQKRIDDLEKKVSALEKQVAEHSAHLQHVPQQQDVNEIKTSIETLKPQIDRLDPLLAAFIIKRLPGEQEDQWLARVKQQLAESHDELFPGSPVISSELNCSNPVRLRVLAIKPGASNTWLYIELAGRKDFEGFQISPKETYVIDNLGHRFYPTKVDQTHLTSRQDGLLQLQLHAGENIRTYLVLPRIDRKAKLFQLYWPGCGIVEFSPQKSLTEE
jgi:hypothetical protein